MTIRMNHERFKRLKSNSTSDIKERVKRVHEQVQDANKSIEEQLAEINTTKLNKKEFEWFKLAREALIAGTAERLKDGKLSKSEVLEIGRRIQLKNEENARIERAEKVLATKPDNFHILTHDLQLQHFINRLREECRLQREQWEGRWDCLGVKSLKAWDFEGTGIDPYIDLSIGMSVWLPILNEGYYLPYGHVSGISEVAGIKIPYKLQHKPTDPQLTRSKVIEAVKPYMTAPSEGKSFHMGATLYDLHVGINDGYTIKGCRWDSRNAMYVMNEHEETYALKPLIQKYGKHFGITGEIYTFEDLFGNCSPAPFLIELVGIYAIKDVYYGWKLTEWQFEIMKNTPSPSYFVNQNVPKLAETLLDCYKRIDCKLPETDLLLDRSGFDVDLERVKQLEAEFEQELEQAKQDLVTAYGIDSEFLKKMSMKLNGHKMKKWVEEQKERIRKHEEKMERQRQIIRECEEAGKTHLKKYKDAVAQLKKYEESYPVEATIENAPYWIDEFSLTNNNHIAFLVYDHLGITDITPMKKPGKVRAVSKDILEEYFKTEESLKPLAKVSEYQKLLTTYIKKIPESLEIDGKLHTKFDATGTETGRYSSSQYDGRPIEIIEELREIAERYKGVS